MGKATGSKELFVMLTICLYKIISIRYISLGKISVHTELNARLGWYGANINLQFSVDEYFPRHFHIRYMTIFPPILSDLVSIHL